VTLTEKETNSGGLDAVPLPIMTIEPLFVSAYKVDAPTKKEVIAKRPA
jgi:hypothetical protein